MRYVESVNPRVERRYTFLWTRFTNVFIKEKIVVIFHHHIFKSYHWDCEDVFVNVVQEEERVRSLKTKKKWGLRFDFLFLIIFLWDISKLWSSWRLFLCLEKCLPTFERLSTRNRTERYLYSLKENWVCVFIEIYICFTRKRVWRNKPLNCMRRFFKTWNIQYQTWSFEIFFFDCRPIQIMICFFIIFCEFVPIL